MDTRHRRRELGVFLRTRRERLHPEDVGMVRGERRRAAGLRREEVAALSGVSPSWYTWLEQGREIRPSVEALLRIAETLRLTDDERAYLSLLAERKDRVSDPRGLSEVPTRLDSIQRILDAFAATPAILYNARFDVVAANAAAGAVYGRDVAKQSSWERNMIWRFYKDPERRVLYPDATHDLGVLNLVEALRLNWADSEDDEIEELIDEMQTVSPDFDAIWRQHKVAKLTIIPGRIRPHGAVRPIQVAYSRFLVPAMPGHAIAALVPTNTEDAIILEKYIDRIA
jgi:transcriptional regulator with XRE-family HTH domain